MVEMVNRMERLNFHQIITDLRQETRKLKPETNYIQIECYFAEQLENIIKRLVKKMNVKIFNMLRVMNYDSFVFHCL